MFTQDKAKKAAAVVTKKKKAKVKKRADGTAAEDGRGGAAPAAVTAEAAVPVHDSAAEEPAGLSARERRAAEEAEYQVRSSCRQFEPDSSICINMQRQAGGASGLLPVLQAVRSRARSLQAGEVSWSPAPTQAVMEARKREVEAERAAAEAAQVRLMEQLSARQEAQARYPCLAAIMPTPSSADTGYMSGTVIVVVSCCRHILSKLVSYHRRMPCVQSKPAMLQRSACMHAHRDQCGICTHR